MHKVLQKHSEDLERLCQWMIIQLNFDRLTGVSQVKYGEESSRDGLHI